VSFGIRLSNSLFLNMNDYVVLVDEENKILGKAPKLFSHNANTPLHRGFSVFLFNSKGKLLLQQRSEKKKTWPLVWSNSCCGHPMFSESSEDAARRRLEFELRIRDAEIHMVLPKYRYKFEHKEVVENEICPVMVAFSDQVPSPNLEEVKSIKWISWKDWLREVSANPEKYSEWCVEETSLLEEKKKFKRMIS